jgi:prepilin-type N-terminal cleavage/methylation domain-containing protein
MKKKAFTLIELLIVVAIIAILAAIAVPNFLEAQVRAKISRAQNDLRNLAVGFESYRTDHNGYPVNDNIVVNFSALANPLRSSMTLWGAGETYNFDGYWPTHVTTPVAYMASLPKDPFPTRLWGGEPVQPASDVPNSHVARNYFVWIWPNGRYIIPGRTPIRADIMWQIVSPGPDQQIQLGMEWQENGMWANATYDATNGTISGGNITRFGP